MSYIENLAVQVKDNCPAINEVTDFAIKEFIRNFFNQYERRILEVVDTHYYASGDEWDSAIRNVREEITNFIRI